LGELHSQCKFDKLQISKFLCVVGAANAGGHARRGEGSVDVAEAVVVAAGASEVGGAGGGVWAAAAALGVAEADRRAHLLQQQKDVKVERRRLSMDLATENKELLLRKRQRGTPMLT